MTKKLRIVLIAFFALIACACLLAGCTLKPTLSGELGNLNSKGAVVEVTYFANEGVFNNKSVSSSGTTDGSGTTTPGGDSGSTDNKGSADDEYKNNSGKVRTIRFKVGSKAIDIGNENTTFESGPITIAHEDSTTYEIVGWYEAVLDSDGNPVYNDGSSYEFDYDTKDYDTSKLIKYDESKPFDFDTLLEKDTHYYLVARYRKKQTVRVVLAGEASSITVEVKNSNKTTQTTYKLGDAIDDWSYETDDTIGKSSRPKPVTGTVTDATFIEYYEDADCTRRFAGWPILYKDHEDDDPENPFTIYAKFIEGNWTVVKTAKDVMNMFIKPGQSVAQASSHFYIFADEIDCKDEDPLQTAQAMTGSKGWACSIRGNGCVIKNLTINCTLSGPMNGVSFFGNIADTAAISDIKFENLTLNVNVAKSVSGNTGITVDAGIFFAFTSIAEQAKANISGVVLSGKMTVTNKFNGYIKNLRDGNRNNWKYGGYENDTEYVGGINVTATDEDLTVTEKN